MCCGYSSDTKGAMCSYQTQIQRYPALQITVGLQTFLKSCLYDDEVYERGAKENWDSWSILQLDLQRWFLYEDDGCCPRRKPSQRISRRFTASQQTHTSKSPGKDANIVGTTDRHFGTRELSKSESQNISIAPWWCAAVQAISSSLFITSRRT